jgi:putrescine transport system substrate-binding protein
MLNPRRFRGRAIAMTLMVALAGCGGGHGTVPAGAPTPAAKPAPAAEEKVLNVLNWSDYIAPDTVSKFEAATGIKVNYDVFDSNEVLETKLLTGRSGYDVVVPSASFLARQAPEGVYLPLDKSKLPNYKNLDPAILERVAANDPGNRYSIPYMWVTTGIGYNVAMVKRALGTTPIDSWAIVFDPKYAAKLKDCGLAMLDTSTEVIDSALIYLGFDSNEENLDHLAAAESVINKVRPYVRYFNSSQYINDLANGEICVAIAWSGDVLQARDRAKEAGTHQEIAYAIPKEGAIFEVDVMAIPADAPHPDNAHKFLDFIMRPDITAEISNFKKYPSGNKAAMALLDPEVRNDPLIYLPEDVWNRLHLHKGKSLTFTRYANRAWTRIRTGQ